MKTALIISVYKKHCRFSRRFKICRATKCFDFITVISEDGNSTEMADFVKNYSGKLDLIHLTQEDLVGKK